MKKNSYFLVRLSLFLLVLVWCMGFTFIQLFPSGFLSPFYPFLKFCYSLLCHQKPEKSFFINEISLFVCARCTGIYIGALSASLYFLISSKKIIVRTWFIVLSIIPLLIDVALHNLGLYPYSAVAAFITGLFSGSVLFIYILNSIEKLFVENLVLNEQK